MAAYDINTVFPLNLHHRGGLAWRRERPDLGAAFLKTLAERLKLPQEDPHGLPRGVTPEDIFHYAYAVLYSATYRTPYAEFLKIDFPRLPLTGGGESFPGARRTTATSWPRSTSWNRPSSRDFLTDWPVKGNALVEKVRYAEKGGRVWINDTQYFGGVPRAVWEFHVESYQVCDKWLKDRKDRKLTYDDTQHYQKIVVALNGTIH